MAAGNIGFSALNSGDIDTARSLISEALEVLRELADRQAVVTCALNAGYVAYFDGNDAAASGLFRECLDMGRRIGARRLMAYAILGVAFTATRNGAGQRAATLHGVFDALFEQLETPVESLEGRLRNEDHARLRALLGDGPFEVAYKSGRALSGDDALALARRSDSD